MINGIDVSDWQGTIDFAELKGDPNGGGFVYAKASEGLTITQDTFRANHDGCKANGIPFAPYHFFHADADGILQAKFFLEQINGYQGTLVPGVDVEQGGMRGQPRNVVIMQLLYFDNELRKSLPAGKLPVIYFEYSLWVDFLQGFDGFGGHPAWPAAYNTDATLDMTGTGWKDWAMWQHSNGQIGNPPPIKGISGNVDRDRCKDLTKLYR